MTNKIIPAILLIFISLPAFSFGKVEKNPVTIYEKINPAIVTVDSQIQDGLSCGTGCIIDKSGVILTSAHVIDIGNTVVVTMSNGQNYDAKVLKHLGSNKDVALLKIDAKKDLKTVKLGDSAKVKVGQKVLAIGNPFGFSGTLTQGIVSRIDYAKNRIQTDAAINPGSSGGPLLNTSGEIIGINQAIYNPDNNISNIGIGFATPINLVKEYLEENQLDTVIDVAQDEKGVSLQIKDSVLFESGKAELIDQSKEVLNKISDLISGIPNPIIIEGHTDNIPINTNEYRDNWDLSAARASNVLRYFTGTKGQDPTKFSVSGYGEYKPKVDNSTDDNRAQNRRVNIIIVSNNEE